MDTENGGILKHRGIRTDNGEWVHGNFTRVHDECGNPTIIEFGDNRFVNVIATTVGEYTGIKDKTNKDIYEGDIIKRPALCGYVNSEVYWSDFSLQWVYDRLTTDRLSRRGDIEVLGNIHENPEMIDMETENICTFRTSKDLGAFTGSFIISDGEKVLVAHHAADDEEEWTEAMENK